MENISNNIIGIDVGSTTTKIIEYNNEKIINKEIFLGNDVENNLNQFIIEKDIKGFDKIVLTGIGSENVSLANYNVQIQKVKEFEAIAEGGLKLTDKDEAIIVSIGTGTALIRATKNEIKHLGGTGLGAGTLINLCRKFVGLETFEDILELSKKGDLKNIDLRIGDMTQKQINTLPEDLTLSNFGKLNNKATDADIVLGFLNMLFETIGMMAAFCSINDNIKEVILVGNIVVIPCIREILKKIEKTHNVTFIIPENAQFAVAFGAIKKALGN